MIRVLSVYSCIFIFLFGLSCAFVVLGGSWGFGGFLFFRVGRGGEDF